MNKRMPFVGFCGLIPLIALFVLAAMFVTPASALAQTATPLGPTSASDNLRTDQIIVKYNASARVGALDFILNSPRLQMLNLAAGVTANYLRPMTSDTHVFKLSNRATMTDVQAIADRMLALPEIEFAESDRILQPLMIPNDPNWINQ